MNDRTARRDRRVWTALAAVALVYVVVLAGLGVVVLRGWNGSPQSAAPATPSSRPTPSPSPEPKATPRPVTIDWWQLGSANAIYQDAADQYMAAHPWVTITTTLIQSAPQVVTMAKLRTAAAAGILPDLLPSWGGGLMAAEVDAGLLKDITDAVGSWKGELNPAALRMQTYRGKQYGIPLDLSIVGFWYNKALFDRAAITAPPETWDQFLLDIGKLKAARIVPYAIGEKDRWPGLHLWTYLVMREGGSDAVAQMLDSGNWETEACVAGARHVAELVAMNPFQDGYMSAPYAVPNTGEAALVGNGQAAMELMGTWAESVQKANSSSGSGIGSDLGWFPFPVVTGGKGAATGAVGGSNGFAIGSDAPPEAVDFLHFLASRGIASRIGKSGALPAALGITSLVEGRLIGQNAAAVDKADFIQPYLDQAGSDAFSVEIYAATAGLFDRTSNPERVCQAMTAASAIGR